MKIRNIVVGLVLLAAVGWGAYAGYQFYVERHRLCDLCGRPVHSAMGASVFLKNKSRVDTCCPRCALHYEIQKPAQVARVMVTDNTGGEKIPATEAYFVEGSDAETCQHDPDSAPREPGVEYDRKFDRCLPNLVAFRSEADAREFQKRLGGRVLQYVQAVQSVRSH